MSLPGSRSAPILARMRTSGYGRRIAVLLLVLGVLVSCAEVRPELPRIVTPPAPGPGRAPVGPVPMPVRQTGPYVTTVSLAAGASPVRGRAVAPRFRWPVDGTPRIVRRFDPPPEPWLAGHRGVDLAAAPGATVRAASDGRVLFAGPVGGRGVVSVTHTGGLRTTYEPVTPAVAAGDLVSAGDILGTLDVGHGGCPAACLHWGLRRGDVYLDPLLLLGLGRMRLKPLVPSGRAARSPPDRAAPAAVRRPARRRRRAGSGRAVAVGATNVGGVGAGSSVRVPAVAWSPAGGAGSFVAFRWSRGRPLVARGRPWRSLVAWSPGGGAGSSVAFRWSRGRPSGAR